MLNIKTATKGRREWDERAKEEIEKAIQVVSVISFLFYYNILQLYYNY